MALCGNASSGSFPGRASVIRLVGALLVEINDEMIAAGRHDIAAASVADLTDGTTEPALPAAPRPGQQRPGNARGHLHHETDAITQMAAPLSRRSPVWGTHGGHSARLNCSQHYS